MRWAAVVVLAGAVALAGCSAMTSPPAVRSFGLDYPPPAAGGPATDATVRVVRFGIATLYDRLGFVYREPGNAIGVDPYNRWASDPASMVTDVLARDLAASRRYRAVLQQPSALVANYELSGEIETFEERATNGCAAVLRMRMVLTRLPERGQRVVVYDAVLEAEEPCRPGDPAAFAAAMSRALDRVSTELQAGVAAAVESRG